MINIPIYRAKEIDSDEYIEGHYTYEKAIRDNDDTLMGRVKKREKYYIQDSDYEQWHEIDPSTLSIHFPDMLDSNNNKIFASLSEDGKGGDILLGFDNKTKFTVFYDNKINSFKMSWNIKNRSTYTFVDNDLKIIGIQK